MPIAIPMAGCVIVGSLTAIQARMNGQLAISMDNGLGAAFYSFASGLIVMLLVLVFARGVRLGVFGIPGAIRRGELRWWQVLGGVLGGFFVAVQATTVPLLGVALFSVAVVAGQSSTSLLVDHWGLGPAGVQPITRARLLSAAIAIVAVTIAVWQRLEGDSVPWLPVIFSVSAGLLFSVQQAVNGRVARATSQPLAATFTNFMFGCIVLGAVFGLGLALLGKDFTGLLNAPWWAYFGGLIGIAFITIGAFTVPIVGVLVFAVLSILGQLLGSLALDIFAPTPGSDVTIWLLLGVALAGVSVAVAFFGSRSEPKQVSGAWRPSGG